MTTKPTILPTANEEWGFWGTSFRNEYDVDMAWNAASSFLAKKFGLNPEQVRDVLDSRFGRHLADDLSMIKDDHNNTVGPASPILISDHLYSRVAVRSWLDCFENAIRETTGKTFPKKQPLSKEQIFTQIAQQHLKVETLVTRNSDQLDFHDVSAWSIKVALEAAYDAGRKSKR